MISPDWFIALLSAIVLAVGTVGQDATSKPAVQMTGDSTAPIIHLYKPSWPREMGAQVHEDGSLSVRELLPHERRYLPRYPEDWK